MAIQMTQEELEHLKYLHTKCGWSVRALADRYGISKSHIHRIIKNGLKPNAIINTDDGV
jgi:DNA-binding MarR family transcriptional regulator